MAIINKQGNVIARCPECGGAKSTFEYALRGNPLGHITKVVERGHTRDGDLLVRFQLFRCAGCGRGGLGAIRMMDVHHTYPEDIWELLKFFPEAKERLPLPAAVPEGIQNEFREAEKCVEHECYRAGAALFRSVLDKTLRANGYKTKRESLENQIDEAAADGIITAARKRRAHEEIRVLGNDVLHDEWQAISLEDVEAAHHYVQRILEDLYDNRDSVLAQLRSAKRVPDEDKPSEPTAGTSGR
jgi:Domain of unknown function (DUF4145)